MGILNTTANKTEKATCILIVKQYNVMSTHAVSVAVTSGENRRFLRVALN